MQSEMAAKRVNCPFCGRPAFQAPGGFLEMGEYHGKGYSVEGSVDGYQCQNGHGFYAWPNTEAVTAEDLEVDRRVTMADGGSPTLYVAVVARGGLVEYVTAHLREVEAVHTLGLAVGGDFDPEQDDARVFRIGPGGSENIYSCQPEEG